jgi:hypothetical protein
MSGGLPSAARRRALRSGCDSLNAPLRLRSTFPARRPQTEADLPRQHPIVGQTAPDIMATVRALMDGSHAQWQFTGAYAANALGLSDQVPAKIVIQTDGVPRRVSLGKLTLLFRRVAPRNLFGAGRPAGLVIQAIRHLRNDPDIPRHIARLKKRLDAKTKSDLKSLMPKTPVWMHPLLQQIVEK